VDACRSFAPTRIRYDRIPSLDRPRPESPARPTASRKYEFLSAPPGRNPFKSEKCGFLARRPADREEELQVFARGSNGSADCLPDGPSGQFRVQCARKKYFAWRVGRNRFIDSAIPPHKRGVGETHPSSGHPSIFAKSPFEEGWITGSSSPVMTIPIGTLF
jgi:hypothetical protein